MAEEILKKVFLPITYEFGGELLKNVYQVNYYDGYKVICHEAGKECLYPSADERYIITKDVKPQDIREALGKEYEYLTSSESGGYRPFLPEGKAYNFSTDIVIFPRRKRNLGGMNWSGWQTLVDTLSSEYRIFAAGHEDYSFHLESCPAAWDYDNALEASIWAIKNSKIRIGLITALTVLSLMCAKDVLVLVSPRGMKAAESNIMANLSYLQSVDHANAGWRLIPHLDNPDHVYREIRLAMQDKL